LECGGLPPLSQAEACFGARSRRKFGPDRLQSNARCNFRQLAASAIWHWLCPSETFVAFPHTEFSFANYTYDPMGKIPSK
jgi:hypothetical protein